MSGQIGPRFDAGLLIYLDAANSYSYQNGNQYWNNILVNPQLYNNGNARFTNSIYDTYSLDGGGSVYFNNVGYASAEALIGNTYPAEYRINLGKDLTCIFWIKPEYHINTSNTLMGMGNAGAATYGCRMFFNTYNTNDLKMIIEVGNGANGDSLYSSTNTITYNQWQQIACVVSKSTNTLKIYLNGINIATKNGLAITDWDTNDAIGIGVLGNYGYYFYKGYMGMVKIYNTIVSSERILDEFNKNRNRFGI